jgi:hypothetical protein
MGSKEVKRMPLFIDAMYKDTQRIYKDVKKRFDGWAEACDVGEGTERIFRKYDFVEDRLIQTLIMEIGMICFKSPRLRRYMSWMSKEIELEVYENYIEALENLKNLFWGAVVFTDIGTTEEKVDETLEQYKKELKRVNKSRANSKTNLKNFIEVLIEELRDRGYSPTKCRDLIYDIFVTFEFENYGKGSEDDIKVNGEMSLVEQQQKDRIRKTYI